MRFDDIDQDGKLQRLIIMHGNVAKTHHAFELVGKHGIDLTALCQKREYIARTLRYPQFFTANQVLPHV